MTLPPASVLPAPGEAVEPSKSFDVGSLRYTFRGVALLFFWLLWGDFAFVFFESVFGRFLPLYLKDMEASNTLVGIMTGSIAGAVNLMFLPGISQWSDRCRTKWGRRIPFLAITTPLTVVALIAIGFAPELGAWCKSYLVAPFAPGLSQQAVVLALLCGFVVVFHCLNMVLCNAFTWLLRDVVPQVFMARFLSWFRLVSTLSSIAFSWYVFPYVISHRHEVFISVGLFYLVAFLLMCWKVREGEYPPPVVEDDEPGIIASFILYFRDCFAVPLYRHYFYALMVNSLGSCAGPFFLLFYRTTLGLSMADLGGIFALGAAVTAVTYLPMGWLCDKFTPIRVGIVAQVGMLVVTVLSFFFIHDKATLIGFTVASSIVAVGWGLASSTLTLKLFPSEKFGQFSAGTNLFGTGISILGNFLVGIVMDMAGSNYRVAYLWGAVAGFALIPMFLVYQGWKRHGGPDNYVPPLPR